MAAYTGLMLIIGVHSKVTKKFNLNSIGSKQKIIKSCGLRPNVDGALFTVGNDVKITEKYHLLSPLLLPHV